MSVLEAVDRAVWRAARSLLALIYRLRHGRQEPEVEWVVLWRHDNIQN
jgi:hypothetical protein